MKKLHLLKTILLLCALIVGSNSLWAALVPAYTLTATKNSGNSSYSDNYNVTIDGVQWNAPGNQNFEGYWRIGGKGITNQDRIIKGLDPITSGISKITVNHNGKSVSTLTVNSVTLTVASDNTFETVIATKVLTPEIGTTSGSFDFTPQTPSTEWTANSYYKFTFNITYTPTSTNHGLQLTSIVFYQEGVDVPITGISLPATADVPVGKTRTLIATVTPDNHTGSVDWESDNTSIATVSSEGVVTGVAVGSTTIRAKSHSDNTIKAECVVTVGEDVATLPFNWAGGSKTNLLALYGITGNGLGDYADNVSNRPYLVQFDAVGDYIQIKTNGQPGKVTVDYRKKGAAASKIKFLESSNGTDFTEVEESTISGDENYEDVLKTTKAFKPESRYVRIYKSEHVSGGNIGVGPISIALPEPAEPVVVGSTVTLTTTVNMAGWRTYNNNTDNKYSVDGNTKVYYASATGDNKVTLTEIDGGVPANTVVILHNSASTTITLTETDASITAPGSNQLQVSSLGDDLGKVYRLGYKSGTGVGFYTYTTSDAPAGIIYVSSVSSANFLSFDFDDVTGIESLTPDPSPKGEGSEYYNLAGQRVAQPTKGLYIVNGRKVIVP